MTEQRSEAVSSAALDDALATVAASASRWGATTPAQRARLLRRVIDDTHAVAPEWNTAACRAKGLDPEGVAGGEELLAGVGMFVRQLQTYRRSLLEIDRTGRPRYPGPVTHRPDDRIAVGVAPASLLDRLLFLGDRAEVWMEPGVDEATVRATQARAYREETPVTVAVVLGAGNVAALAPKDVVYQLIVENRVVVLKMNPINEYLLTYWERALSALIEMGVVRIVTGDASVGQCLVQHPDVAHIHVTGSEATYNAIVFGTGAEGERRRRDGAPLVSTPVSAELGNVSPVIIVPGQWTSAELRYQAAHVATMIVNNAGFNCLTPRVLVTSRQWPQRDEFLHALEDVLATLAPRRAYYPGAHGRYAAFLAAHPDARRVGEATTDELPWTIIRDVDPRRTDDVCFTTEAFCALVSETALEEGSPRDFLAAAVNFCNEVVHGTLCATLLIDPRTRRAADRELERAIADLRYGTIGVNVFHALGIVLGTTTWGAYPGHSPHDIQSGVGVVGNANMFARPQKSVVRGPFRARPTPAWFITHRHGARAMREFFEVLCHPSGRRWLALFAAALRP